MAYQHIKVPPGGERIRVNADFSLSVPDRPIIPYIEGDGTGVDITPVMLKVVDAAVKKAYAGKKKIVWMEMFAGEKSCRIYGENVWLPDETLEASKEYVVSIKGPLTTPVGGGIRSINVSLRQELDLYVCLRPVRWFKGVPSPVKEPEKTDMVIFRENSEDIYAGIEWAAKTPEAQKVIQFLINEMKVRKIRFPETSAIGIKPDNVWLDLAHLAPALFPQHARTAKTLDDWAGIFGIDNYARHDAIADALATAQLLLVILAKAEADGARSCADLLRLDKNRRWLGPG